jgi:hypothetical protein
MEAEIPSPISSAESELQDHLQGWKSTLYEYDYYLDEAWVMMSACMST